MPDAVPAFDPSRVAVGSLADDVPPRPLHTGPELPTYTPREDAPPAPPTLAGYLAELNTERTPDQAGAVPLPKDWRCVRAIIGGASRRDLERAYAPHSEWQGRETELKFAEGRVATAADEGATLPAGLHVVTGQTGGGKTALAVNMVRGAIEGGHPAVYVSLELDGGELAARLLALDTGLPWWKLAQRRPLPPDDTTSAGRESPPSRPAPRASRCSPGERGRLDAAVRRRRSRRGARTGACRWWCSTTLQAAADLPASDRRAQLREYVGELSRDLRTLSREMRDATGPDGAHWPGCPVVVLSITARGNVRGDSAVPGLDGIAPDALRFAPLEVLKALPKEAGAVEAYAVTSWVLAGGEEDEHGRRPVAFRAAKYRGGSPGGWVPFTFDGPTGRLDEAPERYAEALEAAATEAAEREERAAAAAAKRNGKDKGAPAPAVI
jgi:hypothetical protein